MFVIAAALLLLALYYKTLCLLLLRSPFKVTAIGRPFLVLRHPRTGFVLSPGYDVCGGELFLLPTFNFCLSHFFPYTSFFRSREDRVLLCLSPPTEFPVPRTELNELTNKGHLLNKDKHGNTYIFFHRGREQYSVQGSGRFTTSQ